MNKIWIISMILFVLICSVILIGYINFPDQNMHLIACDVGQGDAILVYTGSIQILIDGGPDNSVLDCLGRYIPFWDRTIEVVLLTHPQLDHFGGLIQVFRRYKVEKFIAIPIDVSSKEYQVLKKEVGGDLKKVVTSTQGMKVSNGLMSLDIIWPSELESFSINSDLNSYSIVSILSYGVFDALLTGDIGPKITDEIISGGYIKRVEYLKVPHHGSKNGLTQKLLEVTSPEIAVISVGAKNRYGHPHQEILDILKDNGVMVKQTKDVGDVEVITDGKKWWLGKF